MSENKKTNHVPAHEADKLAFELEKDAALIKRFGVKGSFALLLVTVFVLVVVVIYSMVTFSKGGNLSELAYNIDSTQAEAGFGWQNRGSSATISGYKTSPITEVPQTNPNVCPVARVVVSKSNLQVGETATLSAPAGWNQAGSFHVTNPQVLSISGNVITALKAGTSQVYGIDFLVGNAFPCTADAMTVTVGGVAPTQIQPFIGGYHIISNCMGRSATVTAVSPVSAQIYFDGLRNEGGSSGSNYSGPRSVTLGQQTDGTYRGSLTVTTSHFGAGLAAIFRLTGYSGYAAVSHDYDDQCN